jgi:GTP-binding protein EngB required for normal cell division
MSNTSITPEEQLDGAWRSAIGGHADGASRLLRLSELARRLQANGVSDEARDLAGRVAEGRVYVACLGQCKRGKSTLLNALLGHEILPTGFVPVTAVPTVIRYGEKLGARVRLRENLWREIPVADLRLYVAEDHDPQNAGGATGVEVFMPSPLLASGLCLVDTPGLGSVFPENSAATAAFIPHIDVALIILGADPPLAGEELALIEAIAPQVENLVVVLNKADRTSEAERSAAARFARDLLENRLGRPIGLVFEVSAVERLEDRGPERDWGRLNDALLTLVEDSGGRLVLEACERGVERCSEELLAIIAEQRDALRRPLEASERRIAALKLTVTEAEQSLVELGFCMMAEQQHICSTFGVRHRKFLDAVLPNARQEFQYAPRGFGPSYRRRMMHQAQEIARRYVSPWLKTEQEDAEREYRRATLRFVELGNELRERLSKSGMTELSLMPHALHAEDGFWMKSGFSFAELIELAQPASPLRWLADLVLGWAAAYGAIESDARHFLERLLETNSTRVQSDIMNRLAESRNHLEADVRRLLHGVVGMAEQALSQARQVQRAGAGAIEKSIERLKELQEEIEALRQEPTARHKLQSGGTLGQGQ